jgi:hypothetical protein
MALKIKITIHYINYMASPVILILLSLLLALGIGGG